MNQDFVQIAMDAGIADVEKAAAYAALLTKVNEDRAYSCQSIGHGMRLNYNDGVPGMLPVLKTPFIGDRDEGQAFAKALIGDVDTVGYDIPNQGALQALTSIFTNMQIRQLFQTTPFSKLADDFQNGVFGNTTIFLPQLSARGVSQLYGNFSNAGTTTINANWMERDVVYLQRTLSYADLAVARYALSKISMIDGIRTFNTQLIGIDINNIGFSGYEGLRTFGLLNDPSLNATLISPASAANPSSSQWIYKNYLEICADIQTTISSIVSIAGGQADFRDPAYLVLPPAVYTSLIQQNALGTQTVLGYIQSILPNLEIVQAQNLQGTGDPIGSDTPNYMMVIFKQMGGQPVVLNAYVTPYYSHGVYRLEDYYGEKISFAPAGAYVVRAMGIAIMSGI